jgi:hypothetical protein
VLITMYKYLLTDILLAAGYPPVRKNPHAPMKGREYTLFLIT